MMVSIQKDSHQAIVVVTMPLEQAQEILQVLARINWKLFHSFPSSLHEFFLSLKRTAGIR
jgi:hypothetical protein